MSLTSEKDVEQYLVKAGLVDCEDGFAVERLGGGVSCHVWKTLIKKDMYVLKNALSKLNVQAEWFADPERIHREHEVMEFLFDLLPNGSVPKVYYKDYASHVYVMDFVAHAQTWKDILLNGNFDHTMAQKIARLIKGIHTNSKAAGKAIQQKLGGQQYFLQLRIHPFHLYVMQQYPALAPAISRLITELTQKNLCLVHGDFSPKNILVDKSGNVVLIDFEVAHWGNPVFDLAFCAAHLLLKGWYLEKQEEAVEMTNAFLHAYSGDTSRLIPHLGLLLLARIDGKSPVSYITNENLRSRIRNLSIEWIQYEDENPEAIKMMTNKYLAS
jgi:aminoglycoside phosphotransferase (APT) family kinase protein